MSDRPDTRTIREALHRGFDYWAHEIDDVSGKMVAVTPEAKRFESAIAALDRLEADLARKEETLLDAEAALTEIAGPTPTSHRKATEQLVDAVKWRQGIARDYFARAALAAGTTEAECDGSRGCKATVHILGCFAGPPEDLPPAGTEEESDTTGENFAARVQKAHRLIAAGDEAGLIAYLIGRPREDVIAIASFPAEDTTALTAEPAECPECGRPWDVVHAVGSPASEEGVE